MSDLFGWSGPRHASWPVTATAPEAANTPALYRAYGKRCLDLALVLLALPIALPLVLVAAALVALDGANPILAQPRLGRDGRIFRMWKLRSMVPDAEAQLAGHLAADPALKAEWDHHQKLRNDPRITRIGRVVRALSIDELPQLLNVLTGEMSIVGPRPMLPEQRALYPGSACDRLVPGLTGNWQVSARHLSAFAARADYDAAYEADLSLAQDLRLIAATVAVVLGAAGR